MQLPAFSGFGVAAAIVLAQFVVLEEGAALPDLLHLLEHLHPVALYLRSVIVLLLLIHIERRGLEVRRG